MTVAPPRRVGGRRQRTSKRENTRMVSGMQVLRPYAQMSDTDADAVDRAVLEILADVGMAKATPRVLRAVLAHGCRQDKAGRLRFPPEIVDTCLLKAAKSFTVHGRDPALNFEAQRACEPRHWRRSGHDA